MVFRYLVFFGAIIIVSSDTYTSFAGTLKQNTAEIFKIVIDNKTEIKSSDINLYYTSVSDNRYMRKPWTQIGDMLDISDGLEAFNQISTRIDFTSREILILGVGTENLSDCKMARGGETCASARFDGFRQAKPFWYLPKGAAWVKDIGLHTDRAELNPRGTEYYVESSRTKTILVVLKGVVGARPLNIAEEILVREGEQIEIVSANTRPNPPTTVNTNYLNEIIKLIIPSTIVITNPTNGTITDKPSIQLSGLVSDDLAHEIALFINHKETELIKTTGGKFTRNIPLLDGENVLTLRAMTRYGEARESISVTRVSPQRPPIPLPNVRGRAKTAAVNYLERAGFTVARVAEQLTGRGRSGVVVDQFPAPGTLLPFGSAVDLVVEQPPPLAQVPELAGRSEREARELLERSALKMGDVAHQSTGKGKGGMVVTQTPEPRTLVRQGSKVNFVVEDLSKEVQEAISRIRQGPHTAMPQPSVSTERPTGGNITMKVENATGYTLRVYFNGPQSRILQVPDRQSMDIDLVAGHYQVAAETTDPKIRPFYGQENFRFNGSYRFYVR